MTVNLGSIYILYYNNFPIMIKNKYQIIGKLELNNQSLVNPDSIFYDIEKYPYVVDNFYLEKDLSWNEYKAVLAPKLYQLFYA